MKEKVKLELKKIILAGISRAYVTRSLIKGAFTPLARRRAAGGGSSAIFQRFVSFLHGDWHIAAAAWDWHIGYRNIFLTYEAGFRGRGRVGAPAGETSDWLFIPARHIRQARAVNEAALSISMLQPRPLIALLPPFPYPPSGALAGIRPRTRTPSRPRAAYGVGGGVRWIWPREFS